MNFTTARRWSDNESRFGPFLWSHETISHWGFVLDSGTEEWSGCHLRLHLGRRTLLVELPPIVKPRHSTQISASSVWAFEEVQARQYGFGVCDGFFQVFYGPQTRDSASEASWCGFLPWTQWELWRHSIHDTLGHHRWTYWPHLDLPGEELKRYEHLAKARKRCPVATFWFKDFDEELLKVSTQIEEREYHAGLGAFWWMRWFRAPRTHRELTLAFSGEVGPRKGSWKGGTLAHGIEALPNELHREAFLRYCAQNNLTLVENPGV